MTVAELIEDLKNYNPNSDVVLHDDDSLEYTEYARDSLSGKDYCRLVFSCYCNYSL